MKKRVINIKTILGAALLTLALLGSILSISEMKSDVQEVTKQEVSIDMEKSISVLP